MHCPLMKLLASHCNTLNYFLYSELSVSFGELVRKFQFALFRHNKAGSPSLYSSKAMREFSESHAPGNFMQYRHKSIIKGSIIPCLLQNKFVPRLIGILPRHGGRFD